MMNYPTFLKEVDRRISTCDADSLRLLIHEIARTVPEFDRQRFLKTLNHYCDNSEEMPPVEKGLADRIDSLLKALEQIQAGERELESEYNEEWDEWRDDDEEVFKFADSENILDDIAEALKILHQCLDREEYEKGAKLAKTLSELTVHISGDFDADEMGIRGLCAYDLVNIDLEETIREAMYLMLMAAPGPERAEAMLGIMDHLGDYSVSLDKILQTGSKEIDLNALLPSWIEALAKRPAAKTDRLLEEAQNMLQDKKAVLDNASRYAESHPALYLNLLRTGNDAPEEMMRIGLRGMKEVPIHHPIRSGISLRTAMYALNARDRETAENCWMEAFRTSPTVENYLRLRLQSQHWSNYADLVRNIYTSYYASRNPWAQKPLAALMFFDEQFEEMIPRFMIAGNGIGWSSTFMKEGIALLLLMMNSGMTNRQGLSEMLDMAIRACSFDSASYREGTDLESDASTPVLFTDCFQKWKGQVVLPDNTCESWLDEIDKWLALRVSAIMEANRRGYYGECAAFIAAYGEVLESRGKPGEKDKIMQQYKARYPRRRAFHDALRRFGMR